MRLVAGVNEGTGARKQNERQLARAGVYRMSVWLLWNGTT